MPCEARLDPSGYCLNIFSRFSARKAAVSSPPIICTVTESDHLPQKPEGSPRPGRVPERRFPAIQGMHRGILL